ncbi:hypothetical protein O2N63_08995 [Aliiroseovarius sp. KMU-50]|uniref:Uncharacterized protein n=1 Tax=Aliiroseovarius salicola TaxID=3009082 RepID=A0ABT4W135_9RHOB|nr:hypothetical protein [Aliiroseovarius sp. KMU-50]MDA5094224.1 hypothetical protein [Aliiroseovarius sp. KMU-50]
MPTNRQIKFTVQVAQAAREARTARPRGKPTPENLTASGRAQGLAAMRAAPRCQAKRRDGQSCRAAALRGASRCVKHGGRVEVPDHPHNIKRFLSGDMHRALQRHDDFQDAKAAWDKLTWRGQRDLLDSVPDDVADDKLTRYSLAWLEEMREDNSISLMTYHKRRRGVLQADIWWR